MKIEDPGEHTAPEVGKGRHPGKQGWSPGEQPGLRGLKGAKGPGLSHLRQQSWHSRGKALGQEPRDTVLEKLGGRGQGGAGEETA